ncbi:MerR family transcriptional regulator [Nocardia panacis]|nr:MerR family transcriptional regulator [Nocardia panacis]
MADRLMSIGEVSDLLGVAASTLRWWERQGLITPEQRAGKRWYAPVEVRRLAMIQLWQSTGLMSLDDISVLLAGRAGARDWHDVVRARLAALDEQLNRIVAAKRYLEFALPCHRDNPVSECPFLADEIDTYLATLKSV